MIGHLLGAAGGVEAIVCILSILNGKIHQTINIENLDQECDLNVNHNLLSIAILISPYLTHLVLEAQTDL